MVTDGIYTGHFGEVVSTVDGGCIAVALRLSKVGESWGTRLLDNVSLKEYHEPTPADECIAETLRATMPNLNHTPATWIEDPMMAEEIRAFIFDTSLAERKVAIPIGSHPGDSSMDINEMAEHVAYDLGWDVMATILANDRPNDERGRRGAALAELVAVASQFRRVCESIGRRAADGLIGEITREQFADVVHRGLGMGVGYSWSGNSPDSREDEKTKAIDGMVAVGWEALTWKVFEAGK